MKQSYLFLLLGMFSSGGLFAQESVVSSGGSGSGVGGSNTYSVGQVTYTEISGPAGSAIQGVQQPYEIYVLDVKENPSIKFEAIVYPNPTRKDITLRIVTVESQNFNYELFDMHGRLLVQNITNGIETSIPLDRFESGSYILKVLTENSVLKTFKIIKH
jgi:hypothetical protein